MAATHRLDVLGPFRARDSGGRAIDVRSRKAQALLAYLAVEHDSPQHRETLASLLWSDTGDERARHNLRQALAAIRRCCESVVVAEGDCLRIDATACDVDVSTFTELAQCTDPDSLRECLDLYRGDLLHGFSAREAAYADWLAVARTRLRTTACRVGARLADSLLEHGRRDEAMQALSDLLEIDPAHEAGHRQLMSLLADAGRRSDALRQYQICVEALERELDAEPGPETRELFARLRSAAAGAPAPIAGRAAPDAAPPSVAVLPFENLSSSDDAYFTDGITEDLITALSCFHSLVVISRGSSFAVRGSDLSDGELAERLGAQYLIRGSVRRAHSHVRINVQLLDAQAGLHVWGHRFDREFEDVFALQDEITSTLVATVAGRVEAARLARARKASPERLDAYDLLLRGKDHHHRFTPEDCRLCIEMFERAIERDPTYAIAYAWLGCGLGQAMVFGLGHVPSLVDRCQAAAEKGLALDENESECHRILAQVNLTRGNVQRALQHQERGLFLNPNDDRLVCAMGEVLLFAGRAEEAEAWVRKSMRLNPYHPARHWTHLARALFHQGRYQDALDAFARLSKPRMDDLVYSAAGAAAIGDREAARRWLDALDHAFPDCDAQTFVSGLPFQRERDRRALLEPLSRVARS